MAPFKELLPLDERTKGLLQARELVQKALELLETVPEAAPICPELRAAIAELDHELSGGPPCE